MNETIQTPFTEVGESTLTQTSIQETDETIERPLVQAIGQGISSSGIVQATDGFRNQEMHRTFENALVPIAQNTLSSSVIDNIAIDPPSQASEVVTSSIEIDATGTYVTHESIDKPFVQATQNAWDITIVQEKGESHDSNINLSKNLFNQTTTSIAADNRETVGTQEMYESKGRFTVHDDQNVAGHSTVYETGKSDGSEIVLGNNLSRRTASSVTMAENRAPIDRAPSQASKAPYSSTPPDVCNSFKELDISVQLLPYLEAGVKKHPQVLNWLTTKRRRVFTSSFLSLFADVTRILRTTRRKNLTEDDRNYIRECCAELQGVGFDDGWISYVHRRIEECGDEDDLEMKVEEVEDQLESINKELASMEESLVLLRDRSSRLHGYICLSTLINALFIILFFIIIYVYQKKN